VTPLEPLIAVAGCVVDPGKITGWADEAVAIPARYLHALLRAGGNAAVIMPAPLTEEEADDMLDHFDGVLLAGGGDLDPAYYDQDPHDSVYGVDTQRDEFELELARALVRRHIPTLAICRGAQVLNVALGGTLDQHITDRPSPVSHGIPGKDDGANVHGVNLTAGSRLANAMGVTRADCSCHHHQAIDQLGEGLRVVARADDDVVEGVELDGDAWIVAVQWHPEDTSATDAAQHGLFETFVQHAIVRRDERRAALAASMRS
jgi:putative glutamine amidotransferase